LSSKNSLSYTWYRDSWFGDDEIVGTGSTLNVLSPDGLETYYCVVTNVNGTSYSGNIEVYPAVAPEVASQPQSVNVDAGQAAQLSAEFYLSTGADVEEDAAWYVSKGSDPDGPFVRIADSAYNILNLRSVLATRYYYYEVSNPWGRTRTDVVGVFVDSEEEYPVVMTPPETLSAFSNTAFSYPFSGKNIDAFEWQAPATDSGLSFDTVNGVVSGTVTASSGSSISFEVRALRQWGNETLYSDWVQVSLPVRSEDEYPGTMAERYFYGTDLLDPAVSGSLADPDKDGVVNLLEYAFGTSPNVRDADDSGLPRMEFDGEKFSMDFKKPKVPEGLYYLVEYTYDMHNWTALRSMVGNAVVGQDGREQVRYETPVLDAEGKRMMVRIRIVEL